MIPTERLDLVPATLELARAEIEDPRRFSSLLGAMVPGEWPPETLADARGFFLNLLEDHPDWTGWLGWYALERHPGGTGRTLVGSVGFKGPPTAGGDVEIGYSMLPGYQGRGYASEMAAGLIEWAFTQAGVARVLAQTTDDNHPSVAVLRKLSFISVGDGTEPGNRMYAVRPRQQE